MLKYKVYPNLKLPRNCCLPDNWLLFHTSFLFAEILEFIRTKRDFILDKTESGNADKLLKDAKDLIQQMEDRQTQFYSLIDASDDSLTQANETLELVKEWASRSMNLTDRFDAISSALDEASAKLNDLLANANEAISKSQKTDDLLKKITAMIDELQRNTKDIKNKKETIKKTLEDAAQFAKTAEDYVQNATQAYQASLPHL